MKKRMKKLLCIMLSLALLLIHNSTVFAEDIKGDTSAQVINVPCNEVDAKSCGNYLTNLGTMIIDYAYTNNYYISLRQSTNHKYVLTTTSNGKIYTDTDLVKLVKKVIGKTLNNPAITTINYIDSKFFIVGNYKTTDGYQYFYISTKDGTTYDSGKLFKLKNNEYNNYGGQLYKVGSSYLFAFGTKDSDLRVCKNDGSSVLYYISTDLKTWNAAAFPTSSTDSSWRLDVIMGNGVVVTECKERENHDGWYPLHMYYTTDYQNYHLINTDLLYSNPEASVATLFARTMLLRSEPTWNDDHSNINNYQLLTSNDFKTMQVLFTYDASKYDSNTTYIQRIGSRNKLSIFTQRENDNSLFVYAKDNNNFKEYHTLIKASMIGNGVYDNNDEYSYLVYNKNNILISNDGFVTSYVIQTPMSNIRQLFIINDTLALQGEDSTYYIPIETIKNTVNAVNK